MKKCYRIADTYLEIECEECLLHKELYDYETDSIEDGERVSIRFTSQSKEVCLDNLIVTSDMINIYENEDTYEVRYNEPNSVYGYTMNKFKEEAIVYLTPSQEESVDTMYSIRDAFFFYLQRRGKIVVHSASIIYKDRAWLFSAISGTGKSTHVSLWKENEFEVDDFNGDIAACYINDQGVAVAASMPWCGTSGIYTNKVIPLGGVIFLERSKENAASKLRYVDGVINLTARSVTPAWDRERLQCNIDVAKNLGNKILLGELMCRPDKEAAVTSKRLIDEYLG